MKQVYKTILVRRKSVIIAFPVKSIVGSLKSCLIVELGSYIGIRYKLTEIFKAIELLGIKPEEYQNTIMVGDRHFDIEGANEVGIGSAGVLYGYGSREELEAAGSGMIIETPEGLIDHNRLM